TTEDGDWYWVSDYDWGYIPFHYGRWVWIPGRGWAWIPGRTYAPAWVVWRVGDDGYIGWAAMPPAYYWYGGVAVGVLVVPPAPYVFCSTSYVFNSRVHEYVIRDRTTVSYAASHTHAYVAAHPTVAGSGSRAGASPTGSAAGGSTRSGMGASSYKPASPSLSEA